jgi:DNA-binding CsgD family transcriptional regulator
MGASASVVGAAEYGLLLRIGEALQRSSDLDACLVEAGELIRELTACDHVALALSRPGSLTEYQWYTTTIPAAFFASYSSFADRDFVRAAVAASPNRVIIDQQMITRRAYERHILIQHSRATGANLEQVMAVMLQHEPTSAAGVTCYRSRRVPFTQREACLMQLVVPHFNDVIRKSREYAALQRGAWLEPIVEHAGIGVVWVTPEGVEVTRTAAATALLEQHFPLHMRRGGKLPEPLLSFLERCVSSRCPAVPVPDLVLERGLSCLHVSAIARKDTQVWALIMKERGIDPKLTVKLSPRLVGIATSLLKGMSNEEIARRDGRSVATIKQQATEVYRRLGVDGRKGLIRLASGLPALE